MSLATDILEAAAIDGDRLGRAVDIAAAAAGDRHAAGAGAGPHLVLAEHDGARVSAAGDVFDATRADHCRVGDAAVHRQGAAGSDDQAGARVPRFKGEVVGADRLALRHREALDHAGVVERGGHARIRELLHLDGIGTVGERHRHRGRPVAVGIGLRQEIAAVRQDRGGQRATAQGREGQLCEGAAEYLVGVGIDVIIAARGLLLERGGVRAVPPEHQRPVIDGLGRRGRRRSGGTGRLGAPHLVGLQERRATARRVARPHADERRPR